MSGPLADRPGTIATLAGVPLNTFSLPGWVLSYGLRPFDRLFEVSADRADQIMAAAGKAPTKLIMGRAGERPVTIRGLYVIERLAGSTPNRASVRVVDARWLLRKVHIAGDFNVRRRTGETRLVGEGRIETRGLVDDETYAPWSMNNGRRWSADEILAHVSQQIGDQLLRLGYAPLTIRGLAGLRTRHRLPVENLMLDDPGDTALARVLAFLPGHELLCVGLSLHLRDRFDGSEQTLISRLGAPYRSGSMVGFADRRWIRPPYIDVLFERECELRFDCVDTGTSVTTVARFADGEGLRPPRKLIMAIPVAEPSVTISGRTYTVGSIVDFDGYLPAASAAALTNTIGYRAFGALSHKIIASCYVSARKRAAWESSYAHDTNGAPVLAAAQRVSNIFGHWRRTFRIHEGWQGRLAGLQAYRVGVVDPEKGARAPAQAYMPWTERPSHQGLLGSHSKRHAHGWTFNGYAAKLEDATAAPARVRVLDADTGVIQVDLIVSPFGEVDAVVPGLLVAGEGPSTSTADVHARYASWETAELSPAFSLAVVLTARQVAPNTNARYLRVRITAGEALDLVDIPLGPCNGPPIELKVGAGVVTAQYAWDDSAAEEIEEAFYTARTPMPERLLVNKDHVSAVARAVAARAYTGMADRLEGSSSYALAPSALPTGMIAAVEHALTDRGLLATSIVLPAEIEPRSMWLQIPDGVRAVLQRKVVV